MVKIRNEADLRNWFKKNYKKLGFSEIVSYNSKGFPDFIMKEGKKKVRVELETKLSNFILHKHPIKEVDKVVCIKKDIDLPVQVIEVSDFELDPSVFDSKYSTITEVYKLVKKEKVVTSSEVARKLKVNWNTAEKYLLELVIEGKIERIKKKGVNVWLLR